MGEHRQQFEVDRPRSRLSWPQVLGVLVVAALAGFAVRYVLFLHVQRQAQQAAQVFTESNQRRIEGRQKAADREMRRRAADRALKPGQRCLSGKFIYEIPGGWADDPSQDWKCRPPSGR